MKLSSSRIFHGPLSNSCAKYRRLQSIPEYSGAAVLIEFSNNNRSLWPAILIIDQDYITKTYIHICFANISCIVATLAYRTSIRITYVFVLSLSSGGRAPPDNTSFMPSSTEISRCFTSDFSTKSSHPVVGKGVDGTKTE